jgi:HPt (histidine-containing phosphotransfer) domain-containing protein
MQPDRERNASDSKKLDYSCLLSEYGDEGFLRKVLEVFVEDCPAAMARLEKAAAEKDIEKARLAAHSLSNILGVVRCDEALELLAEIHAELHAGSVQKLPELVPALRGMVDSLAAECQRLLCS